MSTPLASEASTPPAVADVDPPVPSLLSARERKAIRDLIQPGEKLRFRDVCMQSKPVLTIPPAGLPAGPIGL